MVIHIFFLFKNYVLCWEFPFQLDSIFLPHFYLVNSIQPIIKWYANACVYFRISIDDIWKIWKYFSVETNILQSQSILSIDLWRFCLQKRNSWIHMGGSINILYYGKSLILQILFAKHTKKEFSNNLLH